MIKINRIAVALLLLQIPFIASVNAQEKDAANTVQVFGGLTIKNNDADLTLGGTYERRLSDPFGVGGTLEVAEDRDWLLAVPFFWHAVESWRFQVAPGIQFKDSDSDFMVRVGAGYEIEFSGWSLMPEVRLDVADGDVITVLGANFGWKF